MAKFSSSLGSGRGGGVISFTMVTGHWLALLQRKKRLGIQRKDSIFRLTATWCLTFQFHACLPCPATSCPNSGDLDLLRFIF
jgi:hypothetical protein